MRSEASIATSVPVPIARPRSACASAGASLTPSPTIATTRPSACSRRTTSALSAGSTSAITSSMPTSRGDGAGGRLVVAGQQHRPQPERLQRRDRLGRGRLDRVGDDEHARGPRRPRRRAPRCGPAPRRRGARRRARSGTRRLQSASSAGRPTSTPWPSTTPSTPRPSRLAKPSTAGSAPSSLARRGGDRPGDRVLGGVLERAGEAQRLVALVAATSRRRGSSARW